MHTELDRRIGKIYAKLLVRLFDHGAPLIRSNFNNLVTYQKF